MGVCRKLLLNTYNQLPIAFSHGNGPWLFDTNNQKYLDALSGIAVTNLGHNYPAITDTIHKQAKNLLHISNIANIPEQENYTKNLVSALGFNGKVFCNNSGAESLEALIKFARLYGHSKNIDIPTIIVMEKAFHGRSMATITASANPKVKQGFEPLLEGFVRAEFNNIDHLEKIVSENKNIVAVLLEPIQGEGGINLPDQNYLENIRKFCDKHNLLMMLDEVQTGFGRTGELFAFQHSSIVPDAIALAKGIANGIPMGASVFHEKHADLFTPGSHGSTFGGNPLACAVANTNLNEILKNKFHHNAKTLGNRILSSLKESLKNTPEVLDVRGIGFLIGIELDRPCREALKIALKHNIIFNTAGTHTLRLLPPLIISEAEADLIIETVPKVILEFIK